MKDKIKVLFLISILLAFLFFVGPILLRFTWVRNIVSLYFDGLIENEYKSSYMSAIGGMVGTALTITGTLFLQCILDKKDRINKKLQEEKEIQ